ncbi:MAG: hypothetical protein AAGG44_03170, partial [Planctomycetota bacterium]
MLGHGSPKQKYNLRSRTPWDVLRCVCICALACTANTPLHQAYSQQPTAPSTNRNSLTQAKENDADRFRGDLRFVWGGPLSRPIQASLKVDNGQIRFVRNLSQARGSSNSVFNTEQLRLDVTPRGSVAFGGFDFHLDCPLTSTLEITFAATPTEPAFVRTSRVADLVDGRITERIDSAGTRLSVERQAYDQLRVVAKNNRLDIVDCDQPMDVQIAGYRTDLTPGVYELESKLTGSSGQI